MKFVVTAGNTHAPIDKVRVVTNIFSGKTGAAIALAAIERGHEVSLLTSHPETLAPLPNLDIVPYRTYDDLRTMLQVRLRNQPDVVVHSAAVSDYLFDGAYVPAPGTQFDEQAIAWKNGQMEPRAGGKIKSDEPELWLRLVRAPKLVDMFRSDWGFEGILVKFKLEVEVDEPKLLEIAEKSRLHSRADLIVANRYETAAYVAHVGPLDGGFRRVARRQLAATVIDEVERLRGNRK